ncbi:hypothetical protein BCR37DRAFT_392613 [Protomyces lactucae-debilis]|uniref:Uncharacterized protein n=1 Tax=Protomyces lactucae-debilis TaxID=2754530 RepID=A0A1Y2FH47_PROLT|nr:uncharacterized protein BCR37DRAFT_392613 [Protomyces lactucae-debilis]ORY83281.1 hypothetical protein BCR37DRAFT_392613 [Protomyces lactucae-debilis]
MVDNLDDALPEDAEPVMAEHQRAQAEALVEADLPMTREELDMHLADLGVDVTAQHASDRATAASGAARSRLPLPRTHSTTPSLDSPVSRIKPKSSLSYSDVETPSRLARRPAQPERSFTELSEISLIPQSQTPSLLRQPSFRSTIKNNRTGASVPLAQSTPRRDPAQSAARIEQLTMSEKENTRPSSSSSSPNGSDRNGHGGFTRPVSQGRQSLGDRYSSHGSPSSPSVRSETTREIPNMLLLQDHIREMQSKVKQQAQTIDLSEHRIQELERQVEEQARALQLRSREANDSKSARDTAKAQVQQLEQDLGSVHADKDALQQRWTLVQTDLAEQRTALDSLRSAHTKCLAELHALQEQYSMALADKEKAQEETKVLKGTINGLQTQVDQLSSVEERFENAQEACRRYEEQVETLRAERDEVKQELANKVVLSARSVSQSLKQDLRRPSETAAERPVLMDKAVQATRETRSWGAQTTKERLRCVSRLTQTDSVFEPAGAPPEYAADEAIKRQRDMAEMTKQMALQESLLQKLKSLQEQQRETARQKQKSPFTFTWLRAWILVTAALALFFAGYLSGMLVPSPASGMTYAEMRAWHNANALDYLLEYRGVLGGSKYYRWWEGGPLWLEKLCYWLDEKLSDGTPWPS